MNISVTTHYPYFNPLDKYLKVFLTRQEESSNFLVIDLGNFSLQLSKELGVGFKPTSWCIQDLMNVWCFYHQFVEVCKEKTLSLKKRHLLLIDHT